MSLELKQEVLELVRQYYDQEFGKKEFHTGDRIAYAGRVFDSEELCNLVDASLEFWLTAGRYSQEFESEFARFLNVKHCLIVNSGSSANLLAFMALTSPLLDERRIMPGDEVITVAAAFPTTVAPIVQFGAVPVFIDIEITSCNIDTNKLEKALSSRTKAVMLAHTLGNPFNLSVIRDFCKKNNLWLIEDNCDALGSKIKIDGEMVYTGTIGDIGTSSFYPPHQMTMGEGGAVYTNNPLLNKIMLSLRDWGRDCQCPSGVDNICKHRFDRQYGELPIGYDHKFVYSHFGYNLKATDLQASIGCAQLKKLPRFIEMRQDNWQFLKNALLPLSDMLILPEKQKDSEPSWFGFLMIIKDNDKYSRDGLTRCLNENNIQTRNLFAGNLLKHPAFDDMKKREKSYRVIDDLKNTDIIMNNAVWVGVYPGLTEDMLEFIIKVIFNYFGR